VSQGYHPSARSGLSGAAEHLLVADDEPVVRQLITRILESAGYTTTVVGDGLHALKTVLARPAAFDAVVSDMNMPGLDGIGLDRTLRSIPAAPPVLLISGDPGRDLAEECLAELCGILWKPFAPVDLLTAVRACIDARARTAASLP
jgi:CheY-like chemotaxis protein